MRISLLMADHSSSVTIAEKNLRAASSLVKPIRMR